MVHVLQERGMSKRRGQQKIEREGIGRSNNRNIILEIEQSFFIYEESLFVFNSKTLK